MWETEKYCQDSPAQRGGKWQSVAPGRAGWPTIYAGGLVTRTSCTPYHGSRGAISHPQKSTRQTTLTRSRILETKRSSFVRTSCPELCATLAARELLCAIGCAASLASRDELRARRGRADIRGTENDVADEVTSLIPQTHTL